MSEEARTLRLRERQEKALELTTEMRLCKLQPGTHVQGWKDGIEAELMPVVRRHLALELQPLVRCSQELLEAVMLRCTDVFNGLRTSEHELCP